MNITDAVYSLLLPFIGAVCCIRVFPLSMRKFTTIVALWLYLTVCGFLGQVIPIVLFGAFGTPAIFSAIIGTAGSNFFAAFLCSLGVVLGMVLIPISYILVNRSERKED